MAVRAPADTIAAIATGQGLAGIGVVRVSGARLGPFAEQLLGRAPQPRHASRATFRDASGGAIDDGLALYFPAPQSYTGEDVLELQGHGGPVVLQMLLRRCFELGARLAEPGEFTRRAFLNDKLDLAQAEAVADVIEAATETAARGAVRSLQGEFSSAIRDLVAQLVELRALVEATLDFPEEEIDPLDRADARGRLDRLRAALAGTLDRAKQGSLLRTGVHVVLAGQPNVGKSSLLNRLAGEDLAIVTAIPGTTRDTVRQAVQIEGVPLHLVDTAGLRDTADEVERLGIARTWSEIERADLLVLIVDARAGVTAADEAIVARLPSRLPRIVVQNKSDLSGDAPRIGKLGGATTVYLSAKTGAGVELLRAHLLERAGWHPAEESPFVARERHLVALRRAAEHLEAAAAQAKAIELAAEELRLAQDRLNAITGEFTADDLLGEIFGRFCIGK
ncbi:MAG TPA: tRNA uridine-5-carboxymethylaminomethyl(34) synthesis GTPase MnmE [Burkholderiales bacterium]|jgi:tRNA modification GTPase|nr:tRNA uridine-5-carboxymethylaminomethyl(34) synthesis GTPase MnmE [Burkholderiales bacterium]